MKKFFLTIVLILFFGFYILNLRSGNRVSGSNTPSVLPSNPPANTPLASIIPPASSTTPSVSPKNSPHGQYKDGTYTGSVADAFYGNVQVQVTVSNGFITDVQFLQYPNDRNTSRQINSQAMPYLKSEAIQAQSANVQIVSGATDTSMAFQQSLSSALSQAI